MGIFSSKTVVSTGVSVTPLVDERPNLAQTGVVRAILSNSDITDTLLSTIIGGYSVDPIRVYNYGRNSGYFLGLPQSSMPLPSLDEEAVVSVLLQQSGNSFGNVSLESIAYKEPNAEELGRFLLQLLATINEDKNVVTGGVANLTSGYHAEINEYALTVLNPVESRTDAEMLDPTEISIEYTGVQYDPSNRSGTETSITFTLLTSDASTNLIQDWGNSLYVVKYYKAVSNYTGSYTKYLLYDPETDVYPELEPFSDLEVFGEYFPIIPLRIDGEFITPEHPNSEYADNVDQIDTLMGLLTLSRKDIQDALADTENINDIDSTYVIQGIPIGIDYDMNNVKKQSTLKYLFNFFKDCMYEQEVSKDAFLEGVANSTQETRIGSTIITAPIPYNVIRIEDSKLKTYIYWNYIETYSGTYDSAKNTYHLRYYLAGDTTKPQDSDTYYSNDALYIEYHDHVNQTCQIIHVNGLFHVSDVYPGKAVVTVLTDVFESTEETGFFIPVSYDVMRKLSRTEQSTLMLDSLIMVNYGINKTKVKFYQRGAFRILITIVIVVVAVYTQNYQLISSGQLTASQIALLVLEAIAINIVITIALRPILKILIDIFGAQAVLIAAAVLAVVGLLSANDIGNLAATLPSAEYLIMASTQLTTAIGEYAQREAGKLAREYQEFLKEYEDAQSEIEAILETLPKVTMDVEWFTLNLLRAETPDDFFVRTTSPDIGLASLDSINYFYDNALNIDNKFG